MDVCFCFSGLYPRSGIAGSYGNSVFNLLGNCQTDCLSFGSKNRRPQSTWESFHPSSLIAVSLCNLALERHLLLKIRRRWNWLKDCMLFIFYRAPRIVCLQKLVQGTKIFKDRSKRSCLSSCLAPARLWSLTSLCFLTRQKVWQRDSCSLSECSFPLPRSMKKCGYPEGIPLVAICAFSRTGWARIVPSGAKDAYWAQETFWALRSPEWQTGKVPAHVGCSFMGRQNKWPKYINKSIEILKSAMVRKRWCYVDQR